MTARTRTLVLGIVTALICGILIYASFMPLADLSPRAVAFIDRQIGGH